jgi:hypothetical protein
VIPDEQPIFGAGHNSTGLLSRDAAVADLRELLNERLIGGEITYAQRRDQFIASAKAAVVRNRETAGAAADIVKLARQVWDQIEAARKERSDPYYETQGALKTVADDFWRPVEEALDDLKARIAAWDAEEDARIQAQKDEQARFMAKVAGGQPGGPAPAAPAKRRPVRGDYGGKVTQRQEFAYEVTDIAAVPAFILESDVVKAAIIQVVKSMTKLGATVPGIKATPITTVRAG